MTVEHRGPLKMRHTKLHENATPERRRVALHLMYAAEAIVRGEATSGECIEYLEEYVRSLTIKPTYPPPKE